MATINLQTKVVPGTYALGASDTYTNAPSTFVNKDGTLIVSRPVDNANNPSDVIQVLLQQDGTINIVKYTGATETWGSWTQAGGDGLLSKTLSGTTSSSQGTATGINHGISDITKIVASSALVIDDSGEYVLPNSPTVGDQFWYNIGTTQVTINNYDSPGSANILNNNFKVVIWYTL